MTVHKRWLPRIGVSLLILALAESRAGQCQIKPDSSYRAPRPTRLFERKDVTHISFTDFEREYADSLHFDSVYGAADSQHVEFTPDGKSHPSPKGVMAWIEPEEGAWALEPKELAEGRVIARIKTEKPTPLGYGPRWTYWWVDRRGPPGKNDRWRSVFFFPDRTPVVSDLRYTTHPGYQWRQSIAKWGGSQWSSCDRAGCCTKE